jgi:hypothetical protein
MPLDFVSITPDFDFFLGLPQCNQTQINRQEPGESSIIFWRLENLFLIDQAFVLRFLHSAYHGLAFITYLTLKSCFWIIIGDYSTNYYNENWINMRIGEEESWQVKYIYSMYYILMTMTTVGYGDITPNNPIENFCSLFIMVSFYQHLFYLDYLFSFIRVHFE